MKGLEHVSFFFLISLLLFHYNAFYYFMVTLYGAATETESYSPGLLSSGFPSQEDICPSQPQGLCIFLLLGLPSSVVPCLPNTCTYISHSWLLLTFRYQHKGHLLRGTFPEHPFLIWFPLSQFWSLVSLMTLITRFYLLLHFPVSLTRMEDTGIIMSVSRIQHSVCRI